MSRRLLLSVAGLSLLSATACDLPFLGHRGNAQRRTSTVAAPPSPPAPTTAPSGTPLAQNTPNPTLDSARPQPLGIHPPLNELSSTRKLVALTLDDGPHPVHTPIVLEILRKYGVRATFFIVGECAQEQPALVREIAQAGHHLANHTWSHPSLRGLAAQNVRDELQRTSDILQQASGKEPTWFRAPGGDWSKATLEICADLDMRPMGWSVDPRDWSRPGAPKITNRVLDAVRPGSIILNHDGGGNRSQTITALEAYLPVLIEDGYRFTAPS